MWKTIVRKVNGILLRASTITLHAEELVMITDVLKSVVFSDMEVQVTLCTVAMNLSKLAIGERAVLEWRELPRSEGEDVIDCHITLKGKYFTFTLRSSQCNSSFRFILFQIKYICVSNTQTQLRNDDFLLDVLKDTRDRLVIEVLGWDQKYLERPTGDACDGENDGNDAPPNELVTRKAREWDA